MCVQHFGFWYNILVKSEKCQNLFQLPIRAISFGVDRYSRFITFLRLSNMSRPKISVVLILLHMPNFLIISISAIDLEISTRRQLRHLEVQRYASIAAAYARSGISVDVFYHASAFQEHWQEVILEQLNLLDGEYTTQNSSKLDNSKRVHKSRSPASVMAISRTLNMIINENPDKAALVRNLVEGTNLTYKNRIIYIQNNPVTPRDKFMYETNDTAQLAMIEAEMIEARKVNRSAGEWATLNALRDHCQKEVSSGKNAVVLYFHSKSTCCPKHSSPQSDWRDLMNVFNLEFPSICLRALYTGHSTCGVNFQFDHYSGNFWWASCNHIASLPSIGDPLTSAWRCELFLFSVDGARDDFARHCAYRPFHCQVNHYESRCPFNKYAHILRSLVSQDELSDLSFMSPTDPPVRERNSLSWNGKRCNSAAAHHLR
jgi:hypothetical protein